MSHPVEYGRGSSRTGDDPEVEVSERSTLDGSAHERRQEGVAVELLEAGTTLVVRTSNSRYRLTVLDGADSSVLVEGGSLFPTPTEALFQGASSGGSLVKTGWIGVGLRVDLRVGPRRIITSPVRSVTIENVPPHL